ncbi:MAG TPA: hypothetical protein DCQ06_14215 [Myxococcales bacterium]|nr:hypothetical protein [Myxococcales bacterium]
MHDNRFRFLARLCSSSALCLTLVLFSAGCDRADDDGGVIGAADIEGAEPKPADVDSPGSDATSADAVIDDASLPAADSAGGDSASSVSDTSLADTSPVDTSPTDIEPGGNMGSIMPSCPCPKGQVLANGPCVATTALGCTKPCDGNCTKKQDCDDKSAVSCVDGSPAPVCVGGKQAMVFASGVLRVSPNVVTLGETQTLTVNGGQFYIGALYWVIGIDAFESGPAENTEKSCTLETPWKATKAGIFPVEVAYGPQSDKQILAGFVQVLPAGAQPQAGLQPGQSCDGTSVCLQAGSYTCGCVAGECSCSRG